jgi:hypothetical protein
MKKSKIDKYNETQDMRHLSPGGSKSELGKLSPDSYGRTKSGSSYAVAVVHGIRSGGLRRGIGWELGMIETFHLIQLPCSYCGKEVVWPDHNGIDRIDSIQPYTTANSISCCKYCNFAKNDLTLEEFKEHILKVCKFLKLA